MAQSLGCPASATHGTLLSVFCPLSHYILFTCVCIYPYSTYGLPARHLAGDRIQGLLHAKQALNQLNYVPGPQNTFFVRKLLEDWCSGSHLTWETKGGES